MKIELTQSELDALEWAAEYVMDAFNDRDYIEGLESAHAKLQAADQAKES